MNLISKKGGRGRRKLPYRLYKLSAYAMIRAFEQLRGTPFNETESPIRVLVEKGK
jgi:hypothetical protein